MERCSARDMGTFVDDDFLNFPLEEEDYKTSLHSKGDAFSSNTKRKMFGSETQTPFPEAALEEDLEWLSNKDAFPSVETCFDFLSADSEIILEQLSPISVLDSNSNDNGNCNNRASCFGTLTVPFKHPVGIRSKKRRISRFGEFLNNRSAWSNKVDVQAKRESLISLQPSMLAMKNTSGAYMGRRCLHCQAEKTPQWRAGPMGPKTLCNACGVRYKSGRLLPEYRPASSPTFSSKFHSNSHRKVVEMRMQRQRGGIV